MLLLLGGMHGVGVWNGDGVWMCTKTSLSDWVSVSHNLCNTKTCLLLGSDFDFPLPTYNLHDFQVSNTA